MDQKQSEYRENGQTVPRIGEEAVIAPCLTSTALSVSSLIAQYEQAVIVWRAQAPEALRKSLTVFSQMEQKLRLCEGMLPKPNGFFVGADIRSEATLRAVQLLHGLQGLHHQLQEQMLATSVRMNEYRSAEYRGMVLASRLQAESVSCATECENERMDGEKRLEKCRTCLALLLRTGDEAYRLLYHFCSRTMTDFNVRVEKNANLRDHGERCEPNSLRSDLGSLLYVCQTKRTELEKILEQLNEQGDRI